MAEHFYGYGRWDAPFWFIGPEAGMGKDGEDGLAVRCESWRQLGCAPIVDCAAHHRGFAFTKWHQHHPPTQPTWRQLIRLLLAFKGMNPNLDDIRAYQRDHWGRENGETCVIELSGVPAPNMRVPRDRLSFLSRRVERIRHQIREYRPELIVMYGVRQRKAWEQVAGTNFDSSGICHVGKAVAAIARHPVTVGGLLFSDTAAFALALGGANLAAKLANIRGLFSTPEDINDDPDSAPSKRVAGVYRQYNKVIEGTLAAQRIGIDRMLAECPHFRNWIERLAALPAGM